ncbi:MAG: hypothetical protein QOI68_2241, partial [Pseudonocardiales bacterium]|nr:hypothetical protein [Pseudonocardiales bacterium]
GWLALGCLLLGAGLLVLGDSGWAHAVGVLCLAGFMVLGYLACAPSDIAADDPAQASG